jgi:hypothetical protein
MRGKPKSRNWNDVQTAIAMAAIVATLAMWNVFASPSKAANAAKTSESALPPPPTEPPVEVASVPTAMPLVKIIFTPGVTPTTAVVQQQVQQVQQPAKKKKNRNNNNNSGGSVSVTQTKSS